MQARTVETPYQEPISVNNPLNPPPKDDPWNSFKRNLQQKVDNFCFHFFNNLEKIQCDLRARYQILRLSLRNGPYGYISLSEKARVNSRNVYTKTRKAVELCVDLNVNFFSNKKNKEHVAVYLFALALFTCYIGAMHGFDAVSRPFIIGFASGGAVGLTVAIARVAKGWAKKEERNTLWNTAEFYRNKRLDATTNMIITMIITYVIFEAVGPYPSIIGAATGFIVAEHGGVLIGLGLPMGQTQTHTKGSEPPLQELPEVKDLPIKSDKKDPPEDESDLSEKTKADKREI